MSLYHPLHHYHCYRYSATTAVAVVVPLPPTTPLPLLLPSCLRGACSRTRRVPPVYVAYKTHATTVTTATLPLLLPLPLPHYQTLPLYHCHTNTTTTTATTATTAATIPPLLPPPLYHNTTHASNRKVNFLSNDLYVKHSSSCSSRIKMAANSRSGILSSAVSEHGCWWRCAVPMGVAGGDGNGAGGSVGIGGRVYMAIAMMSW